MRGKVKKIVFGISIVVNIIFIALFSLALLAKTASLAYLNLDDRDSPYLTAAALISVPASGVVIFDAVSITMKPGGKAALQFSTVSRNKQANWLMNALYDHDVIAVEQSGYGVLITALRKGETVMQVLSEGGIRDIARITVTQ
jgi:hypothetical protein